MSCGGKIIDVSTKDPCLEVISDSNCRLQKRNYISNIEVKLYENINGRDGNNFDKNKKTTRIE